MQPKTSKRFFVKNLDCAACAAKIETGLKRMDGVEDAVIDFAGSTLQVKGRGLAKIQEMVRRIDPGVDLVPQEKADAAAIPPSGYQFTKELALLCAAAILFVLHLIAGHLLNAPQPSALQVVPAIGAYLLCGWNVFASAWRTIQNGDFFDENVLMIIATVGALAINALSEAVGVMLFYKVGETLQELAVSRSRRSIGSLLAARPDRATIQSTFGLRVVPPELVAVGDIIVVKPGEKVPLDGTVISGESQLDTSPLTGEPRPATVRTDDTVMAGAINLNTALTVCVTRPYQESSVARILDLVQNAAARKASTEKFITTFARGYTPAVVIAAAGIALLPPLLAGADFQTWIYRALVLLVISCPCALVISIPLGYFAGVGRASRLGILVKGSNFLDALAAVKTVVFDKTGTLTRGDFEVEEIISVNGYDRQKVLKFAAAAETHSTHPIATSIVRAFADRGGWIDAEAVTGHEAISGVGVRAAWAGHEILVGSDALLHSEGIPHDRYISDGTTVNVVVDRRHIGRIRIGDRLKPGAHQAMDSLRTLGVDRLIMLSGDSRSAAQQTASVLGLDRFHAELLPEDKVRRLEAIMECSDRSGKVAFVGDGINDAPVLARADVGIAMGALGSDAAIETADVVLMTDSPAKVAQAIAVSRRTRGIVWQNIVLALSVKGVFVVLGALGMAGMWEAVFADVGTTVLAVLNATRALRNGFGRPREAKKRGEIRDG
jgi:Cd2+/Zn2+-exporting ATPase